MNKGKSLLKILLIVFTSVFLYSSQEDASALTKQRLEIQELKKELNNFYNTKEKEYTDRKSELETLQAKLEKERNDIQALHDKNLALLQDIKNTVESKTAKIYNGMKPKSAAAIFDEMINEGKIEEVFDIILKLNEKKVTSIMKFMSVQSSMVITEKLENFSANKKE